MAVRRKYVRTLVERILNVNGIDKPPVPVENLVATLGADLRYEPANDDLSGFLIRDPKKNQRAIIGVNLNHATNRKRFTVAHELGHFLMHQGDMVHVDRFNAVFQVKLRSEEASKGTDIEEIEANLFAAELLMPASFLKLDLDSMQPQDIEDEEALRKLASIYEVSLQALTFRLVYLGYVKL